MTGAHRCKSIATWTHTYRETPRVRAAITRPWTTTSVVTFKLWLIDAIMLCGVRNWMIAFTRVDTCVNLSRIGNFVLDYIGLAIPSAVARPGGGSYGTGVVGWAH